MPDMLPWVRSLEVKDEQKVTKVHLTQLDIWPFHCCSAHKWAVFDCKLVPDTKDYRFQSNIDFCWKNNEGISLNSEKNMIVEASEDEEQKPNNDESSIKIFFS